MILSLHDVGWKNIDFTFQYSLNFGEQKITFRDSAAWMIEKGLSTSPFSVLFGGKAADSQHSILLGVS